LLSAVSFSLLLSSFSELLLLYISLLFFAFLCVFTLA
jgi:hypothetical protein